MVLEGLLAQRAKLSMSDSTIESVLQEQRVFEPPAAFSENARIPSMAAYQKLYDEAAADPAAFWASWLSRSWTGLRSGIRC